MPTAVARISAKPQPKKPTQVHWSKRSKSAAWSSYCDLRAVVAVMAHIHCVTSEKHVSVAAITQFIASGSFGKLLKSRQKDVIEAFDGRRVAETEEMVGYLVIFLAQEGVVLAEYEYERDVYWIDPSALGVLNAEHERIYPHKIKKPPKLRVI